MGDEERGNFGALVAGGSRELVAKTNTLAKRGLELAEAILAGQFTIPQGERPASKQAAAEKGPNDRILCVMSLRDPVREIDKLTRLYESVADARREVGEEQVPFRTFADFVKGKMKKLRQGGSPEVVFRVALKGGNVNFTAWALKGVQEQANSKSEADKNKGTTTPMGDDADTYLKDAG
jgi:hypothetical protein